LSDNVPIDKDAYIKHLEEENAGLKKRIHHQLGGRNKNRGERAAAGRNPGPRGRRA